MKLQHNWRLTDASRCYAGKSDLPLCERLTQFAQAASGFPRRSGLALGLTGFAQMTSQRNFVFSRRISAVDPRDVFREGRGPRRRRHVHVADGKKWAASRPAQLRLLLAARATEHDGRIHKAVLAWLATIPPTSASTSSLAEPVLHWKYMRRLSRLRPTRVHLRRPQRGEAVMLRHEPVGLILPAQGEALGSRAIGIPSALKGPAKLTIPFP